MKFFYLFSFTLLFIAGSLEANKQQSARTYAYSIADELAAFTLADGFVIELVASEVDGVINPIDLTFDDAGRLWTQTASMYPMDPNVDIGWQGLLAQADVDPTKKQNPMIKKVLDLYQGKTKGNDKILIIPNPDDKKPKAAIVWADGLAIPQSILPYKDGAYVVHGAELIFLNDSNKDGLANERSTLLSGLGFMDTHTMTHLLNRAPAGWIHFSQGALNKGMVTAVNSGVQTRIDYSKIIRMSLDGEQLNVVSAGLNNIWGFQLRSNGQWFGTEANDIGEAVVSMEEGTAFPGIGGERIREYQPFMNNRYPFRVGGTGISGLAFADDTASSFPDEWKDVALLANGITNSINAVRLVRNADGTVTAEHLKDLLSCKDDWFRPVNLEFGPDGCLYIADWYNKIISHNEVRTDHPDRDKSHGRIWRIRHKSQEARQIPNLVTSKTKNLLAHLKSPSLWEKRAAWHQIADRNATELAPQLVKLAADKSIHKDSTIITLWALESIKHFDKDLIKALLASSDGDIRRECVRSLASFDLSATQVAGYLKPFIDDKNVMVRSQVLRTLAELNKANDASIDLLLSFCRPVIAGSHLGGPYERRFERYLARKALEQYPQQLAHYLKGSAATKYPASHIFWASQALDKSALEKLFLTLWDDISKGDLGNETFIIISQQLDNSEVFNAVQPYFESRSWSHNRLRLVVLEGRCHVSPLRIPW